MAQQQNTKLTAEQIQALVANLPLEEQEKLFKKVMPVSITMRDNGVVCFKVQGWVKTIDCYIHRWKAIIDNIDKIAEFITPKLKDWPEKRVYKQDSAVMAEGKANGK